MDLCLGLKRTNPMSIGWTTNLELAGGKRQGYETFIPDMIRGTRKNEAHINSYLNDSPNVHCEFNWWICCHTLQSKTTEKYCNNSEFTCYLRLSNKQKFNFFFFSRSRCLTRIFVSQGRFKEWGPKSLSGI